MRAEPFRPQRRARLVHRVQELLRGSDSAHEIESVTAEQAAQIIRWCDAPYHHVFADWLRSEADTPADSRDRDTILTTAIRANAFREVLDRLKRLERQARATLEQEDV